MSEKFNTAELMVQWCSNILQWWRGHKLEFQALSDLARKCPAWCKRALLWTSVSMAGHVANSRGASLKSSSASAIRFLSNALKAKKDALKVDQKVSQFYFRVFLRASVLLWNEPQNKLPPETKRFAWVFSGFQTRCDRCRFWMEQCESGLARVGRVRGAGTD